MNTSRPPSGSMVLWRLKDKPFWHFGYCTYISGPNLIRLGLWNGDTMNGPIVSAFDIEWKEYRR